MTSSPDLRRLLRGGTIGTVVVALGLTLASPLRADTNTARATLNRALIALDQGNATAARALATAAVAADPNWGLAHAVLARTALAQDDGIAAEAELNKARDTGFDMARGRQMLAHARLLQSDARQALEIAKTVAPAYAAYGLRVQARATAALGDAAAASDLLDRAVAQAPNDSATWGDVGRFRQSVGDVAGAIDAADRAVALNPDNTDALLLRAQLVRGQYGLVAALPWFEAALRRDPANHAALVDYAATLGDAGRYADMLSAARRALAVRAGSPQALYLLAVMAARAGNADLARDLMENAGGALDGMPGPLLLGATLDLGNGAAEQAVTKLRNLIALQPMNIRARQLLAVALMRLDASRDALDILRPVAQRGDADSYTLTLAARAFERIGERDLAAQYLDRAAHPARADAAAFGSDDSVPVLAAAADSGPAGDPATAIPLIRAQLDGGDRAGALARAQAVAAANPGAPKASVVLGDTLMAVGRPGDAAVAYRRAASLAFDEPTMLRLTEALDMAGRRAEASNALALFLSQNPASVAALRLAAHWQIAAGEYDAAIDTLEGLRARIGDRDAALLAELAYAHDGAGNDDEALSYAAAAYALAPANAAAADAYGWALYGAGDAGSALQLLQKAVAIAPGHAALRWHLAQVYADLGQERAAQAHARAALADPRFADRAAAQALVAAGS
ncbi:tetratricopeptide repeat protein [Sphingomonas sp.]|uniref:tetratricopeptide repeat protein n=1 Tax=Sphingomonas sp. TaxID=28214 RepID=UPI002C9F796F|nr:tetratricopeptide repeat protein [Sphingomonas sp.]HWK35640.1 tetratricopeptide repeat protein [Sphingomonas sp.]